MIFIDEPVQVLDKAKINGLVRLLIKKLVIPCIDDITQIVYDLLKAKLEKAEQKKADKNKDKDKDGNE